MYSIDYIERIAKVAVGPIMMEYDTDFPMRWTWCDQYYEYTVMLAPRIEDKEE